MCAEQTQLALLQEPVQEPSPFTDLDNGRVLCACGSCLKNTKQNKDKHLKTKKHTRYADTGSVASPVPSADLSVFTPCGEDKVECVCGSKLRNHEGNMKKHLKTKKHLKYKEPSTDKDHTLYELHELRKSMLRKLQVVRSVQPDKEHYLPEAPVWYYPLHGDKYLRAEAFYLTPKNRVVQFPVLSVSV